MIKKTLFAAAIGMIVLSAFTTKHQVVYVADTKLSSLEWYAEKLTGKHNGVISLNSGSIVNDHGSLTATFDVNMTTILTKDMTGEYATKLDNHLKSADFFDATKYPSAKFVSTSITPIKDVKEGGFTHNVKGNLTIKDKTNEITFDAVVKGEGNNLACVGTAVVDRSKFDVKFGSKSFFPEIGDKVIYDEFKLKFNVVAVQQSTH
jgi:polyisoprenoid-binding protein YceI